MGKYIDFNMTTNATMLTSEIISFLAENNVGVTVSIDGPRNRMIGSGFFTTGREVMT